MIRNTTHHGQNLLEYPCEMNILLNIFNMLNMKTSSMYVYINKNDLVTFTTWFI